MFNENRNEKDPAQKKEKTKIHQPAVLDRHSSGNTRNARSGRPRSVCLYHRATHRVRGRYCRYVNAVFQRNIREQRFDQKGQAVQVAAKAQ